MAQRARVLIAGGYGVFGRLLARELAGAPADLVIAGRDRSKAEAACRALGPGAEPLALDLRDPEAFARAARGCVAVACTAGPFPDLDPVLPRIALEAGAHWLDIADSAKWVFGVLDDAELDARARQAGLAVMTGLSSTPALSGVLARATAARVRDPARARIALFIGNRNEKGAAAIASALTTGFEDPQVVEFPFGSFRAYRFRSPDEVLLRRELGVDAEFRVALELGLAARVAAATGRLTSRLGARALGAMAVLARPLAGFGSTVGAVQAEVWGEDASSAGAAAVGTQSLAILPCALALEDLLAGRLPAGEGFPGRWIPPDQWKARLRARGVAWHTRTDPERGR